MKLSPFIEAHREQIHEAWEADALSRLGLAERATFAPLRDHLGEILAAIARDLDGPTATADSDRWTNVETVAAKHGAERAHQGVTLNQMVPEFPALRSCVTRLWFE